MVWSPSPEEMQAVLAWAPAERYAHAIEKFAETGQLWSLWQDDGWALAGDPDDRELVPVWPHEAYAAVCADGVWATCSPMAISLEQWFEAWMPGMERDGRLVAVFPTPAGRGVPVEPARLAADLRAWLVTPGYE